MLNALCIKRSTYLFIINVILWIVAASLIFSKNSAYLFLGYDGAYMRQLIKFASEWGIMSPVTPLNPLQGLANISIPINFQLSPTLLIMKSLGFDVENTIVYSVVSSTLLFISTYFLASSLHGWFKTKLYACWFAVLFIMPVFVPHNQDTILGWYGISAISPISVDLIAVTTAILALIVKSSASESPLAGIISIAAASLLLVWCITFFTVLAPLAIVSTSVFFLFGCMSEFVRSGKSVAFKLLIISAKVAVIIAICTLPFIYLITWPLATVVPFFATELLNDRSDLTFVSQLFHGFVNIGWASTLIWLLAWFGSVFAIIKKESGGVIWPIAYLVFSTGLLLTGLLLTFCVTSYRGVSALYFEWMLWPFMFCIAVQFLASFSEYNDRFDGPGLLIRGCLFALLALLVGYTLLFQKTESQAKQAMPPLANECIDDLRETIGLQPGGLFQGSTAFFEKQFVSESASWIKQTTRDHQFWAKHGFELRGVTLWYNRIPTLFAYNQFITPEFYLLTTRLLAKTSDQQIRSVLVLTQPNIKILSLLGVRFVLSQDEDLLPRDSVQSIRHCVANAPENSGNSIFTIFELANPNIGNYSPINTIGIKSGFDIIEYLRREEFDPKVDVVLDEQYEGRLVEAEDTQLKVWPNQLSVESTSKGTSILVLPLTYSHALQITNKGTGNAKLVRANLAMAAIIFDGHLKAKIKSFYGPYSNIFAKFNDAKNFSSFLDAK